MHKALRLVFLLILFSTVVGCCKEKHSKRSEKAPSVKVNAPMRYDLIGPSASHLLTKDYPRQDIRIEVAVLHTAPGTILDTVGIAAAKVGSFACEVLPTGHVQARIYDPTSSSNSKQANGWHLLTSRNTLSKGMTALVVFESYQGNMALWVDGTMTSRLALNTALSGDPIYLGDYPADAAFAPRFNTNTGMTGSVDVLYFGKLDPDVYVSSRGLEVKP